LLLKPTFLFALVK